MLKTTLEAAREKSTDPGISSDKLLRFRELSNEISENLQKREDVDQIELLLEQLIHDIKQSQSGSVTLQTEIAMELEDLGVHLWNTGIKVKRTEDGQADFIITRKVLALRKVINQTYFVKSISKVVFLVKTAGFLLILAGTGFIESEQKCGETIEAQDICNQLNELQEKINDFPENAKDANESLRSENLLQFYLCRARIAWKLGNSGVAHYMIDRITGKFILLEFGKQKNTESENMEAAKWLKKAVSILDCGRNEKHEVWSKKVLVQTLESLGRQCGLNLVTDMLSKMSHIPTVKVYLTLDDSYISLAESAADLLIEESPSPQAYLSRIEIMNKKNMDRVVMEKAYLHALKSCEIKEDNMTRAEMALKGLETFLADMSQKIVEANCFEKLIVVYIHLSAFENKLRPELTIEKIKSVIFDHINESNLDQRKYDTNLSDDTRMTCQMDREFHDALKWYEFSERFMTENSDMKNKATLQRKIAMCHIENRNVETAYAALEKAQKYEPNSALNFFIYFRLALEKDDVQAAILNIQKMCNGINFSVDLLDIVVNLAYESESKDILRESLHLLYDWKQHTNSFESESEQLRILRDTAWVYIEKGLRLIRETPSLSASEFRADITWFFKICWNLGIKLARSQKLEPTYQYFEAALVFLNMFEKDQENLEKRKICLFMCSASQILFARNVSKTTQRALKNIDEYHNLNSYKAKNIPSKRKNSEEGKEINEQLIVLRFEAKSKLHLWDDLYGIVQHADSISEELNVQVFERIADIILKETECPLTVLLLITQAVLDNILKKELVDYVKFSHWFRIIVMTAMRNDAEAAYQFFIQIQDILKSCNKGDYPQTEIEWLTVTAWNKGIEFYGGSDIDKAKKWSEMAVSLLSHLNDKEGYEKRMYELYGEILSRYQ
ncbi:hypothetical protein K493DRAFT_299802 [Basidiobolus meristosporus CBS 931.73]|uniref:Protein ZIP4 homolog n=1 Tax=Basidiobolus meristosporus CBS 931.73 TaxID=1314790 RepID=A0A1Y1YKT7_9FUNG|nr:hypothetical protein K493DRAFT_299802 [Basidiobolus meristosporus CBS 931.73]|eukprot:ORX98641.1 hypothetical protein K493DRAFT_299802 [Basidiobolus meristosporus CBS 931.73]